MYINIHNDVVEIDDIIINDVNKKIIANSLKSKLPKLSYRFNKGIEIRKNEP